MNKKIKLDYAPKWKKPFNWQSLAAWVTIIAMVAGLTILIECNVNWSDFCG